MRQPITFAYRNLVFGESAQDAWALYRVETSPYDGLTVAGKKNLLGLLASFAYSVEADFQLLRVSREWSTDHYLDGATGLLDPSHGHATEWNRYLDGHRQMLGDRSTVSPAVFLAVRLAPRNLGVGDQLAAALGEGLGGVGRALRDFLLTDARGLSRRQLEGFLADEQRVFERTTCYLDCERASTGDLEWLVRRAFSRSLGEPVCDPHFAPQALVFEDEADEVRFIPLERDLLRLMDSPVAVGARGLEIRSELGESHQALLTLGALPEVAAFPGRQAELLFAPLEALPFAVDASLCARFVTNDEAISLARKRIVDADNTYVEEAHGDHGPSSASAQRPHAARELEEYLTGAGRPPLLQASISLAVAAPTAGLLEDRIEQVRREYAPVVLHRPLGDQLGLFDQHLPAQRSRVTSYEDYLTVEQLGAMVPTASNMVGSDTGSYIGHTLSGSRRPVLWDLTEASRTSRPPSMFLAGTLGSGKTIALQLFEYQAFLAGSRIVDIDPKGSGDHRLAQLPGVEGHVERIELSAGEEFRGMLDPLRIGLPDLREDLAVSFLFDVLPQPVPPAWKREVIAAVRATLTEAEQTGRLASCGEVIDRLLKAPGDDARAVGDTLEVYADMGLARLAFGTPASVLPEAGHKQVTMLGIRNLARPLPGTPKSEFTEEERIGRSLLRLLAALATRLLATDPSRHAVGGFDEAHDLLSDSAGRRLVQTLNRMARSLNVTPILASQTVAEVEELANLLGAVFVFGMESQSEAARALSLLGLDPESGDQADELTRFRAGRCFVRDYQGRIGRMQIDVADPALLRALDTTPDVLRAEGGSGVR